MANNDLEYSIGLNTAPLQQAGKAIGKFGDDSVTLLNKKFSAADMFKGFLQGAGILSVTSLAEKMIAPFRESAESAKAIADESDRAAAATEKLLRLRQSDAQQLAAMEKQMKALGRELENAVSSPPVKKFLGFIERGSGLDKLFGFSRREDAERSVKIAAKEVELKEKALEVDLKRKEVDDKRFDQQMRNDKQRLDWVKQNREQVELEAKALSGRILPAEKARLDVLLQQQKIRENEERITNILATYPEKRTEEEKRTLAQLFLQREAMDKQLAVKQGILAATGQQVAAEAKVGEVIESNIAKWREFSALISSSGRGDRDLSDRELQKKIRNINNDIFQRTLNGGGYDLGSNLLLEAQRGNLTRARAEQDFRSQTRRNVANLGEDRAFQLFGGSEQRFQEILRGSVDASERLVDRLNETFNGSRPFPVVVINQRPPGT